MAEGWVTEKERGTVIMGGNRQSKMQKGNLNLAELEATLQAGVRRALRRYTTGSHLETVTWAMWWWAIWGTLPKQAGYFWKMFFLSPRTHKKYFGTVPATPTLGPRYIQHNRRWSTSLENFCSEIQVRDTAEHSLFSLSWQLRLTLWIAWWSTCLARTKPGLHL